MQDWKPETPIFTVQQTTRVERTITVDQWPRQVEVDPAFLLSRPEGFDQHGDRITITVNNGWAVYRRVEIEGAIADCYQLESAQWQPPALAHRGDE